MQLLWDRFELGNSGIEHVNRHTPLLAASSNEHLNDLANAVPANASSATNSVGAQVISSVHKPEKGFSGTNTANELPSSESTLEQAISLSEAAIELLPASRRTEVAHITLPSTEHTTLESLRDIAMVNQATDFELSLASPFSSFGLPANIPQAGLFSDVSVRFAYNFDTKNQIAFKLTRGSFVGLSTISTHENGFTDINGQLLLQQENYAGELFYQRRGSRRTWFILCDRRRWRRVLCTRLGAQRGTWTRSADWGAISWRSVARREPVSPE